MDLTRIAAKQKRAKDWLDFAENELRDPALKPIFVEKIGQFKQLLLDIWTNPETLAEKSLLLADLERQLEELHLESRLRLVPQESLR